MITPKQNATKSEKARLKRFQNNDTAYKADFEGLSLPLALQYDDLCELSYDQVEDFQKFLNKMKKRSKKKAEHLASGILIEVPVAEPIAEPEPVVEPIAEPLSIQGFINNLDEIKNYLLSLSLQGVNRPDPDPVDEPDPDPVADPDPDPVDEPDPDPVDEPIVEPEPVAEPIVEPEPESEEYDIEYYPDPDPVADPDPDPVAEHDPENDPVAEHDPDPDPVDEPIAEPDPLLEVERLERLLSQPASANGYSIDEIDEMCERLEELRAAMPPRLEEIYSMKSPKRWVKIKFFCEDKKKFLKYVSKLCEGVCPAPETATVASLHKHIDTSDYSPSTRDYRKYADLQRPV
jgi:hypothetical protein